jgi:geranylgeranyl pyrophosphate synthase
MLMVNLPEEKLWDKVNCLLSQYGQEALQFSKNYVLQEKIEYEPLSEALRFFFESWFDVLHPTLIALSCEAVGGNKNQTVKLGAAVVLLAGAADIHDDIMDQSKSKESNLTVYGKFGQDIAILAGDTLLLKGIYLLHEGCETLQKNNQKEIFGSIKQAFFEMSSGVAREANFRGKSYISLTEFLSIIKQKVATVEATMRIGAIIGGGSDEEISILSNYGRTYGMLLSLRDEFADVFEADEIKNRLANECLPLPVLLALQDDSINLILSYCLKKDITEENLEKIVDLSLDCKASRELVAKMKSMIDKAVDSLSTVEKHREIFTLLLKATIEDI